MSPPRRLRILRLAIVCLIIVSCMGTTLDRPIQHAETVNGYINLALLIGYTLSLFSLVKFSIPSLRALLLIFLATISFLIAGTWVWRNNKDCFEYKYYCPWRVDVGMDLPTMILVIVEAILTVRWEYKERKIQGLVGKRVRRLLEEEAMAESGVIPVRGHILAPDEQDNVEVFIPSPPPQSQLLQLQQHQYTQKGPVAPAQAHFPSPSPPLHPQQQHLHIRTFFLTLSVVYILASATAHAQSISEAVKNVRLIGSNSYNVLPVDGISSSSASPIIRVAKAKEKVVQDAYWIDFAQDFDQHDRFSQWIKERGPDQILIRQEFWGEPLNAISLEVKDDTQLKEIISTFPGIKLIEPVVVYKKPKTVFRTSETTREKDLSNLTPHKSTGVAEVHESLKLFGKGIKVGVIDSGVDYMNPALGGCFGKGCKVAYGYDFVGDDGKSPDNDPRTTCDEHGTHVTGIIAGNGTNFLGVAPHCTIGAYRVFSCKGSAPDDAIIKALLRAAEDGMQIINLSLGAPGGWNQEREARVVDMLSQRYGIIVVAAAGNEGSFGAFESASPGVASSAITVSSSENPYLSGWYFTIESTDNNNNGGVNGTRQDQRHKIVFIGDKIMNLANTTLAQIAPGTSGNVTADACNTISRDLKGKIALVRRGDCTYAQKLENLIQAKATGVIIMNNIAGDPASAASKGGLDIPVRSISREDGEYLLKQMQIQPKQGVRIIDGPDPVTLKNPIGGQLSNFTSLGPDSELNSKPDITAPGGSIWSTFPLSMGGYGIDSGTSMASPYIAGCAALFLEANPKTEKPPLAFKATLQNYARPILESDAKQFKGIASAAQQGAGFVQMMNTLTSNILVSPSHISLSDTNHLNKRQTFTITNRGNTSVTYRIDLVGAAGLTPFERNGTVATSPKRSPATASMKPISSVQVVRVAPGSSAKIDFDFSVPKNNPKFYILYSGYVRFRPEKIDKTTPMISVPFLGMNGDYKTVKVFDSYFGLRAYDRRGRKLGLGQDISGAENLVQNMTKLKSRDDGDGSDQDPDDLPPKDIKAIIQFKLLTACKLLVLDLVSDQGSDPTNVKSYGLLNRGVGRYLPRNDDQQGNESNALAWDGKILDKDGKPTLLPVSKDLKTKYRFRISLLKHFGDMEKDEDYESFLSKPFSLSS
ncbi:hypothetical protein BGZ83_005427 [Gryganskiella cystojenkinii]|nr:hypothetical protein BGZ83_005427 [Gryganskiella cystojenkinii]